MIDFSSIEKYRENNRIEAKKATGGFPYSVWETYSAFANTVGGVILLGVEETKEHAFVVAGLPDAKNTADTFWNGLNDPELVSSNILSRSDIQVIETDGKEIVAVFVPRATRRQRPIFIEKNPFGGTYRRNGEGDYHCSVDEVKNMIIEQSERCADSRVLSGSDMSVICADTVRRYRERLVHIGSPDAKEHLSDSDFLISAGCAVPDENGRVRPTCAGLLMFGYEKEIRKEYPSYRLSYLSQEKNGKKNIRILSSSGEFSGNLYDFYVNVTAAIKEDLNVSDRVEDGCGDKGVAVRHAIYEAVLNAIVHANYSGSRGLEIIRRGFEIRITNPGGLRVNLDGGSGSDPRNMTIRDLFLKVGYGASGGMSSVRDVWKKMSWEAPLVKEDFDPDTVTVRLTMDAAPKVIMDDADRAGRAEMPKVSPKQWEILDYLTEMISDNVQGISDGVGMDEKTVKDLLKGLEKDVLVLKEKDGGKIKYRLNDKRTLK